VEGLGRVRRRVGLPIVAIGGIGMENAAEVIRAGADGIAVIGAVAQASDPEAATRMLLERIREAKGEAF